MSRRNNERRKQGFTLMEMLIVVAVIAVLIAVAIPVFSSSLHKSRVATDWANLRSYYAELQSEYLATGKFRNYGPNIDEVGFTNVGRSAFILSGQEIDLKAGKFEVTPMSNGYQLGYWCEKQHEECNLSLGGTNW